MSIILILYLLGCFWYSAGIALEIDKALKNGGCEFTERVVVATLIFLIFTIITPAVIAARLWVYITKKMAGVK